MAKNKSLKFIVSISIIAMAIILVIFGQLSGAWFTYQSTQQNQVDGPNLHVAIYYDNDLMQNNSFIFDDEKSITLKNSGNISAYIRARVTINCVDAQGNILANYDPSDYIEFSYDNFRSVSGYQTDFIYYHNGTNFVELASNGTVILIDSTDIVVKNDLPEGVQLNISIFAEAVQKDTAGKGLSRWEI